VKDRQYILLVDDDQQVLDFMRRVLEGCGYEVSETTSGEAAVAMIRQRLPDLLILDLSMPEMDGFDLLRVKRYELPQLRVLAVSGFLEGALLNTAKLMGAVGTIQKPFTPEELAAKVQEVLEK
jgi:CheY-like chemotaxis protein